ncbi:MAG: MarR family transcriptional regulator [Oscillospiraceae bacterium]|nr:MarR family transcriptional regulator [Oscillospiraceae bacterium]
MISKYEHFSLAVSRIYHDIQKIERMEMEKFGLKGPHAQTLLAMLRYPEGITSVELCEICVKDKAAISRSVAQLQEMGMIQRQMHNGTSYRAALQLTHQGEQAARAVAERARLAVEQAGIGLEDDQREVFYQVLDLISNNLHGICKVGL